MGKRGQKFYNRVGEKQRSEFHRLSAQDYQRSAQNKICLLKNFRQALCFGSKIGILLSAEILVRGRVFVQRRKQTNAPVVAIDQKTDCGLPLRRMFSANAPARLAV